MIRELLFVDPFEDIAGFGHDEGDLIPSLGGEKGDDLIEFSIDFEFLLD